MTDLPALLLGATIGGTVALAFWPRTRTRPDDPRPGGDPYLASCLECGTRYRGADPFDAAAWAYDHQWRKHER